MFNTDHNIPVGFHFSVEFNINGLSIGEANFKEVSGLSVSIPTDPLVEGGENRFKHQLPQRPEYSGLTLKRGVLLKSKLVDWCVDA
ncbi:MAG: phage tail protein, partial [Bacteroidales bacterium]|nr:phage tail protein [Bacteroidales bacterium]